MGSYMPITYSKRHRETSFHPSVHLFGHPFVPSWSVYFDGVKKEWNIDPVWQRIIYISVVNFIFIFIFNFGVFGLRYIHPISFSTTERVGLGFFFFL
jgi:hypothetical protein